MNLVIQATTLSENNPISIHKIVDDEFRLRPGEKKAVTIMVFPRRAGVHALKGIKITDRAVRDDKDHSQKGYSYTYPKFSVEMDVPN